VGIYPVILNEDTFAAYPPKALRVLMRTLPKFALTDFQPGQTLPLWAHYEESAKGTTHICVLDLPRLRLLLVQES